MLPSFSNAQSVFLPSLRLGKCPTTSSSKPLLWGGIIPGPAELFVNRARSMQCGSEKTEYLCGSEPASLPILQALSHLPMN